MTMMSLLCIDIQERQFSASTCLTTNLESLDVELDEKKFEDKSAYTLQFNSVDDDKVFSTVEV